MAECNWDPSKHGGKPCPVHGAGGEDIKGREVKIPYHKNITGKIVDEIGDTYEVEYTTDNGITRREQFYKDEFDDFDEEFGDSKDGMFYREMEDGTVRMAPNKEDLYEESAAPEQLKSEFNDLLKEGLSKEEAARKMLDNYEIPEDEVYELFGVDLFDDDYDFDDWDDNAGDAREILGRIEDAETLEELEEVRETLEDWYDQGMLVWDDYNGLKEEIDKAKKQFDVDFDDDEEFDDDDFDNSQTSKPMDYNQAKSYVKQKLGVDLDEETYNLIRGLK